MTDEIELPQSRTMILRLKSRIESILNKPKVRKIFMIVISGNKIKTGWATKTDYNTVNFEGHTYDTDTTYLLFGYSVLFAYEGVRIPINFSFLKDFYQSDKKLTVSSKEANIKMNSRNISEFVKANKNADFNFILLVVCAGTGVITVLSLYNIIHIPFFDSATGSLEKIIKMVADLNE